MYENCFIVAIMRLSIKTYAWLYNILFIVNVENESHWKHQTTKVFSCLYAISMIIPASYDSKRIMQVYFSNYVSAIWRTSYGGDRTIDEKFIWMIYTELEVQRFSIDF